MILQGGSTKAKIARASNCRLDMDDTGSLEFSGPAENCSRAREYVELVLSQRKGAVFLRRCGRGRMTRFNLVAHLLFCF